VLSKTLEEREGDLGGRASLSRRDGARAAMVLTNHKFFSGKLAASWGAPVGLPGRWGLRGHAAAVPASPIMAKWTP
jgi:hypothetical protein